MLSLALAGSMPNENAFDFLISLFKSCSQILISKLNLHSKSISIRLNSSDVNIDTVVLKQFGSHFRFQITNTGFPYYATIRKIQQS